MMLMVSVVVLGLVILAWFWTTQPTGGGTAVGVETPPADARQMERDVRMLSRTFAPRDVDHIENLDRAAQYVFERMRAEVGDASEQSFEAAGATVRNIIASAGARTAERVVVGAHYDAFGPFPGADDNASGIAGLLQLGRMMRQRPPPMRVDLVAYTTEEPPFFRTEQMGSAQHADLLKRENASVRAMICLEMIGYFSDLPQSQHFPLGLLGMLYPHQGNFIAVVGSLGGGALVRQIKGAMRSAGGVPVYSINAPVWIVGIDLSDHQSYWARGYPAVMVTDTAFFRNPHYHTALDTPERLDYGRMAQVVEGVYRAVFRLASPLR